MNSSHVHNFKDQPDHSLFPSFLRILDNRWIQLSFYDIFIWNLNLLVHISLLRPQQRSLLYMLNRIKIKMDILVQQLTTNTLSNEKSTVYSPLWLGMPFWQHSQITLLHLSICVAAKHKAHSLAWKSKTTWWKLFSSSHSFIQKRSGPVNSKAQRGSHCQVLI